MALKEMSEELKSVGLGTYVHHFGTILPNSSNDGFMKKTSVLTLDLTYSCCSLKSCHTTQHINNEETVPLDPELEQKQRTCLKMDTRLLTAMNVRLLQNLRDHQLYLERKSQYSTLQPTPIKTYTNSQSDTPLGHHHTVCSGWRKCFIIC